jgi:hypothetical protein
MTTHKFLIATLYIVLTLVAVSCWDILLWIAYSGACYFDNAGATVYRWLQFGFSGLGGGFIGWFISRSFFRTVKALDIGSEEEDGE